MSELPIVLLPVGVDDDALDACLAALDAGTPTGTRVWLAETRKRDRAASPSSNAGCRARRYAPITPGASAALVRSRIWTKR